MADLGAIGTAPWVTNDGGTLVSPLSLFNSYGFNSGPWIPEYPFQTNVAVAGLMTPTANAESAHNTRIRGLVSEAGVPVANAQVALLMQRKYGMPPAYSWSATDVQTGMTIPHQGAITVPDMIRTLISKSDGVFSLEDIRKYESYIVIAYNPDPNTVNARAVGAYVTADDLPKDGLVLDFVQSSSNAWRMFFILP